MRHEEMATKFDNNIDKSIPDLIELHGKCMQQNIINHKK